MTKEEFSRISPGDLIHVEQWLWDESVDTDVKYDTVVIDTQTRNTSGVCLVKIVAVSKAGQAYIPSKGKWIDYWDAEQLELFIKVR